jgi:hypothetical protein
VLLPMGMLVISDTLLAPHDNGWVQAAVHAMVVVPLALGRLARGAGAGRQAACWGLCGFVPATAFFLVTNFAVWAGRSRYPATLDGLLECYAMGLPFYRTMLAGDMCYVGLMVACVAAAYGWEARTPTPAASIR